MLSPKGGRRISLSKTPTGRTPAPSLRSWSFVHAHTFEVGICAGSFAYVLGALGRVLGGLWPKTLSPAFFLPCIDARSEVVAYLLCCLGQPASCLYWIVDGVQVAGTLSKIRPTTDKKVIEIRPKIDHKSTQIGVLGLLGGSWGTSWGISGASWRHVTFFGAIWSPL